MMSVHWPVLKPAVTQDAALLFLEREDRPAAPPVPQEMNACHCVVGAEYPSRRGNSGPGDKALRWSKRPVRAGKWRRKRFAV